MYYKKPYKASNKVEIDAMKFDSLLEAKWYLCFKEAGFELIQREPISFNKDTLCIKYTPDFKLVSGCKEGSGQLEDCYVEVKDSLTNFSNEDLMRMNNSIKLDDNAQDKWFVLLGAIPNVQGARNATANFVAFRFDSKKSRFYLANARIVKHEGHHIFQISNLFPDENYGSARSYSFTDLSYIKCKTISSELLYHFEIDGFTTDYTVCEAYCLANGLQTKHCMYKSYDAVLEAIKNGIRSSVWYVPQEEIQSAERLTDEAVIQRMLHGKNQRDAELWSGKDIKSRQDAYKKALSLLKRLYFWCNGNEFQIMNLFEKSPLYENHLKEWWWSFINDESDMTHGEMSYIKAFNSTWETFAIFNASRKLRQMKGGETSC